MATTTRETIIANPARKAKKGGKMTAKQIKFFGTKRQRAALKAKRKRAKPAAKKHRARTKPNPSRKKKRVVRNAPATVAAPKKRKRKSGAKRRATKRKNPGALYALMNPARKGRKTMARTKKRKASGRKNPAGIKRRTTKRRSTHRRNPGAFGKPMDWLSLGGGAIAGSLAATSLPQMILGSSNSGPMGYLAMAASTALIAVASNMVSKRNQALTMGVVAGGAGALIRRLLSDYTPYGAQLANSGMGDYVANWNFTTPQIIGGNGNTALGAPGNVPVSVAGAPSFARALQNI